MSFFVPVVEFYCIEMLRLPQRMCAQLMSASEAGGKATDLLGDADASVTSCEADAVDSRVLSQEVSNLRSLAYKQSHNS